VLPKFGADGKWGTETSQAVASFQSKNGIQPGGFEAGRKTLLALDAHLQQQPPKPQPPTPPGQNATVTAQCGQGQQAGTVIVTGSGFPPGEVDLAVDGIAGNAALAGADKTFTGSVSANLKDGSHVVKATSGSIQGLAQFTTPCGAAPQPTPSNQQVTTAELLVLAKFEFMHETQRDATEDAIKDLQPLDKDKVPLIVQILEMVATTYLQFEYGVAEQLVRNAIVGPEPKDFLKLMDNGLDKAFDFLQDNVKDGIKDELKDEHDAPSADLAKHLEPFRRGTLAALRVQNFKLQKNWITEMQKGDTSNITPAQLQVIGDSVERSDQQIYKAQYDKVVQSWASYLAQAKVGGGAVIGPIEDPTDPQAKKRKGEIAVTNLDVVDGKDADDVPGILVIGIEANDGGALQSSEKLSPPSQVASTRQMVALNDIHIFGLSEETRKRIQGPVGSLGLPLVLRGEPSDGGRVVIGKDEAGRIVDGGSDNDGKKWLGAVSKALGGSGDTQDGMERLFDRDLKNNAVVPGSVEGP